ncbi:MAG TPA: helix-turn-helix transcriptional regulator [Vicinamibacteria bacterium]
MAAQVEAQALASAGCAAEQERLGAALVAALEVALVAAHRLLGELDRAAGRHAERAAHLARAQTLAGGGAAADAGALALLALAERCGATERGNGARPAAGAVGATCTHPRAAPAYRDGLSAREVEVLHMLAGGMSNRQIAAALYLSLRTVERHIANLYAKTGARGRAAATAYALRHHLA